MQNDIITIKILSQKSYLCRNQFYMKQENVVVRTVGEYCNNVDSAGVASTCD